MLLGQEPGAAKGEVGEKGKAMEKEEREEKREEEEKEKEEEKEEDSHSHQAEEACLQGLSDEIRDMLVVGAGTCSLLVDLSPLPLPPQIMQEAFQCSLPVLRALFEASGSDVNQFIMSSEQ